MKYTQNHWNVETDTIETATNKKTDLKKFNQNHWNDQITSIMENFQFKAVHKNIQTDEFGEVIGNGWGGIYPTLNDIKKCVKRLLNEIVTKVMKSSQIEMVEQNYFIVSADPSTGVLTLKMIVTQWGSDWE